MALPTKHPFYNGLKAHMDTGSTIPINDTTEADRQKQMAELMKHIERIQKANPWVAAGSGGIQQVGTATTGNVIASPADIPPGGISAPMSGTTSYTSQSYEQCVAATAAAAPEKPVKRMNEMTFADFQRGVDNWWPHRNRG